MAAVDPFNNTANRSPFRVPKLPGQAWVDHNSPMARLAVGEPAVDNLLARTATNSYTRAVNQVMMGGGPLLAGTGALVAKATCGSVQDSCRPLAADYFSTYRQTIIPEGLLHGVKAASGVAGWGNQAASMGKLAPSVSVHSWMLRSHKSVFNVLSGFHTGAGNTAWEFMMGKQIASATASIEPVMRAVRNVASLTQGSVLKSLMGATNPPVFTFNWGEGFKAGPAPVPLSNLGPAATDYAAAARRLHETLGLDDIAQDDAEFIPTANDTAYEMLARLAPEVAVQVDAEAASVKTSFWQRRAVRNSLAWTAWGLLHLVIIFVMVILPSCGLVSPWAANSGAYALSRLESKGLSPKMVKDKIAFPRKDPDED